MTSSFVLRPSSFVLRPLVLIGVLLAAPRARAVCGDGIPDAGEECDDHNTITETLPYGQTAPCEVCDASCRLLYDQCQYCGDGTKQPAHEQCDDGGLPDPAYPNTSDCSGCDEGCHDIDVCYSCGDGHTDSGFETCDDSNTVDGDGCSSTCVDECIDGIDITLDPTWIQAGGSTWVNGHVTNDANVPCDAFLLPGALGSLSLGDTSGIGYVDVPAHSDVPFTFEVLADWDSPGHWTGSNPYATNNDHDWQLFYVLNEGSSSDPGAVGTACILPAGEVTLAHEWDARESYDTIYDFRAKIPPVVASFETRQVDEEELESETTDTCYWNNGPTDQSVWGPSTVPQNMGRGSEWVVQSDNRWGPSQPDVPGSYANVDAVGAITDVIGYYQSHGPNAGDCGVTFVQHMKMSCQRLDPTYLRYKEYTSHEIGWYLTGPTEVTVFRDQLSETTNWP